MHNNYYFLRQLSLQLAHRLPGWEIVSCFSQNKNELILGLTDGDGDLYIKASLNPDFCCLSFPTTFHRAGKNSVDIFPETIGKKIISIKQFKNERSFAFILNEGLWLLFKMHGNRSNIILIRDGQPINLFKNSLKKDWNININELDRDLNQDYKAFIHAQGNYRDIFPTFGKVIKWYLEEKGYGKLSLQDKWNMLSEVKEKLESPDQYFITIFRDHLNLSLLKAGNIIGQEQYPITAINKFFYTFSKGHSLLKEKKQALRLLEKLYAQSVSYIEKTSQKLKEIENSSKNEEIANIIMANLHNIPPKAKEAELFDFYNNSTIKIRLKPNLSPQKNAEGYYRKAKNQKIEIAQLRKNLDQKEASMGKVADHINIVKTIEDVKSLRKYLADHDIIKENQPKSNTLPFKRFNINGYEILIGKSARNNDLLTQKYSYKEDLWLHAKDVSGSHVVVKHQAGKKFPKPVIEKAAQLAAWYSKRKTDSLCPVIYTPKKFVRKPKGSAPGQVIVDKEQVILVKPEQ